MVVRSGVIAVKVSIHDVPDRLRGYGLYGRDHVVVIRTEPWID
jgi:hypothetical protein